MRFATLLRPYGASPDRIAGVGRRLVARYAEPVRRYHTVDHVTAVLATVEQLWPADHDPGEPVATLDCDAVRLAGWFHDAIYDPTRPDNEARSAALARAELASLAVPGPTVAETSRLIDLTAGHGPAGDDRAGAVLVDADLAILAALPAVYDRYAAAIRSEYAHVPDGAFRDGRRAVLASFLGAATIFSTAEGRRRFEAPARANLRAEHDRLQAP